MNKKREKRKKKDGETEEHVKTETTERVIQLSQKQYYQNVSYFNLIDNPSAYFLFLCSTLAKPWLTEQNLRLLFNSRSGWIHVVKCFFFATKRPGLELKTWPGQRLA